MAVGVSVVSSSGPSIPELKINVDYMYIPPPHLCGDIYLKGTIINWLCILSYKIIYFSTNVILKTVRLIRLIINFVTSTINNR